jgi:hypothetical protein
MNEIDEWREAKRWRLLEIFYAEEPIWKDEDHAELKDGAAEWVRKMRTESEARFECIQRSSGRAGTKNAPTPLKTPGPVGWQAKAPALLGADVGQALSPANPTFRTASSSPSERRGPVETPVVAAKVGGPRHSVH